MSISVILSKLLQLEGSIFIQESYRQFLNREPTVHEVGWGIRQLTEGSSKVSFFKKLLNSNEASILYEKPILIPGKSTSTIADIIRTFYKNNLPDFLKSVYKETLGIELNRIDVNKFQSLFLGITTRTSIIANIIQEKMQTSELVKEVTPTHEQIPLYSPENLQIAYTKGTDVGANQILSVRKSIPNPYVVILSNGRFWGGNGGAVLSSHGKVYTDLSSEMGEFSPFLRFQPPSQPNDYLENVAVLQSYFGLNFFHWMFDVVARLDLVHQSKIPIDKYITPVLFPFQEELLTMLGVPGEKRIQMQPQLYLQAKQLIAPSYTGCHKGIIPKWACDFLRRELLLNRGVEKLAGYERIYISRAHAQHRKVVNEEEVMNILGSYGFKSVNLEFESVARKIQIFNSAKMIVAPHGAGLTNLLFCNAGTKVVEIFSPNWIYPCFRVISHYMDLDYEFITGKGQKLAYRTDMRKIPENIIVDINELMPILERV